MIEKLYIAEKPSQTRAIADALGFSSKGKYYVKGNDALVSLYGHMISLAPPEHYEPKSRPWNLDVLPIIPTEWEYSLPIDDSGKMEALQLIEKLLKQAKEVVISSDYDREGESLVREILEYYNYKGSLKRIKITDLNPAPIRKAVAEMFDAKVSEKLNIASIARSRGDWLHGMNMTMAVSSSNREFLPPKEVLHFGRVQTVLTNLVSERELEIKNFIPIPKFDIKAIYEKGKQFKTKLFLNESVETVPDHKGSAILVSQKEVDKIMDVISTSDSIVKVFDKKRKESNPRTGYSLSELQKDCNSKFGFSADDTAKIAQKLYESKMITYPRTDSGYLDNSLFGNSKNVIDAVRSNYNGDPNIETIASKLNFKHKSIIWDDSKIGSHHGIIPTELKKPFASLTNDEKKVYDLICRMFMSQFLGNYVFDETSVVIGCDKYEFKCTGTVPVSEGHKLAFKKGNLNSSDGSEEDEDTEDGNSLPQLKVGEKVNLVKASIENSKTKPADYYNDATLLQVMVNPSKLITDEKFKKIIRNAGIGTEATRAKHIENLFLKKYCYRSGKSIRATEKGLMISSIAHEFMKSPQTIAYWEQLLIDIEDGKESLNDFMQKQEKVLKKMIDDVKEGKCKLGKTLESNDVNVSRCPCCDSFVTKGKTKNNDFIWFCQNKENCGSFFSNNKGKVGSQIAVNCKCCDKKAFRNKKKNSEEYFWVCNSCSTFYNDVDGKIGEPNKKSSGVNNSGSGTTPTIKSIQYDCKTCGNGKIVLRKTATPFFGCTNFPNCKQTYKCEDGKPVGY